MKKYSDMYESLVDTQPNVPLRYMKKARESVSAIYQPYLKDLMQVYQESID